MTDVRSSARSGVQPDVRHQASRHRRPLTWPGLSKPEGTGVLEPRPLQPMPAHCHASRITCCLRLIRSMLALSKRSWSSAVPYSISLYEPLQRLVLSVDERGGCERKQVEERLDRQSIIEQIGGLPCFNAERDMTSDHRVAGSSPAGCTSV